MFVKANFGNGLVDVGEANMVQLDYGNGQVFEISDPGIGRLELRSTKPILFERPMTLNSIEIASKDTP